MKNLKEIRWKQRFENFDKSFRLLKRTIAIKRPSEAERGGLIQFFETTFELAWKVLKDYLESEGIDAKTPRDAIKQAFKTGILLDGMVWIKMLDDRNLTSHIYDEAESRKIEQTIRTDYFPSLKELHDLFRSKV